VDLDFCRAEPELSREEGSHTKMRCTVCQREFKSLPALNGHMRSHGGLRTHPTSLKMVQSTLIWIIYGVVCLKDVVLHEIQHADLPHWFKFLSFNRETGTFICLLRLLKPTPSSYLCLYPSRITRPKTNLCSTFCATRKM